MPMCPMCRTDATVDHLSSDFHKFNLRCTNEGKTPMSEDLFNQFEAHKMKNKNINTCQETKTAVQAAVQQTTTKNVNAWHWEEKNVFDWAKERIPELLKSCEIPVQGNGSITITNVKDIKGDAYLNVRKGKMRVGFEISCEIEWKGVIQDGDGNTVVECTGKAKVENLDDDHDDDEYEECVRGVKLDKDSPAGSDVLLKVMKKLGRKEICKALYKWNLEIRAMAKKRS